ncbi:hypothetical protein ACET3Z_028900 [Daucus carota]
MEHNNKRPSEKAKFLPQASHEFAKEQEPEIQTDKISGPNVEKPETIVTDGDEPPFDYNSDSDSESEVIVGEESEIQTEKKLPETADEAFDDSNALEPFPVRLYYTKRHFSDDSSSTDSSYLSDSDSDETIAEEESKISKENSSKDEEKQLEFPLNAAPQEDHTRTEPIEERPNLDSDPENRIVPASSILVKHGNKRAAEEVGDEDSKRAK